MTNKKDESSKNGIIFIYISLSILAAITISEVFSREINQYYFHALVWIGSFLVFFLFFRNRIMNSVKIIKSRIKKSTGWPLGVKIMNGICWAGPFFFIIFMPSIHEYLILLGIGLGNISTALIFLKYNRLKNVDQMIVGQICLISIIIIAVLYQYNIVEKVHGEFLARILISLAYGIGGIYSLLSNSQDTYSKDVQI